MPFKGWFPVVSVLQKITDILLSLQAKVSMRDLQDLLYMPNKVYKLSNRCGNDLLLKL